MAVVPLARPLPEPPADPAPAVPAAAPAPDLERHLSTRTLAMAGGGVVAVFVLGFGIWAVAAPLSAAILAPGKITVDGQWKVVQAPQTAMVEELAVKDGQVVAKDQLLIRLDKTQFQAEYDSLRSRYLGLLGQRAKLYAERDGLEAIAFPPELADALDPEVQRVVTMQEADFRARSISLASTLGRIQAQLAVAEEELTALTSLDDTGLISRARLYPLRYTLAELRGQEMEIQLQTEAQRAAELQKVEADLAEVTPRLNAARVAVEQMDIRATASGKVIALTQHTVGGMVAAGEKLMDIVPSNADFVVEAMVKPDDIDDLSPGMAAHVQLSALQRNTTPSVEATVIDVSADRITTENADYYAVKVHIDDQDLRKLGPDVQLYPGMPAEVMIPTHQRTFLDYLVQPVTDTMLKSFREP